MRYPQDDDLRDALMRPDHDDGHTSIERATVKAERKVKRFLVTQPPVLNYAPGRLVLHLHYKRQVCAPGPDLSMAEAWQSLKASRQARTLYKGSWTSNYYMVEGMLEGFSRAAVSWLVYKASGAKDNPAADSVNDEDDDSFYDSDDDTAGMPDLDPVDIEHQMLPPPQGWREMGEAVATRAIVFSAMQPFSNACTWSIVGPDSASGAFASWALLRESGQPLWNGAMARAVSGCANLVARDYLMLPLLIRASAAVRTHEVHRLRYSRQSMFYRVRTSVINVYTRVAAALTSGAICYPLECVRLRIESQYVVYGTMRYSSWANCVRTVYATEGVAGFYRGMSSWALAVPLEAAWPLIAWQVARGLVYAIYEDDPNDDADDDDVERGYPALVPVDKDN